MRYKAGDSFQTYISGVPHTVTLYGKPSAVGTSIYYLSPVSGLEILVEAYKPSAVGDALYDSANVVTHLVAYPDGSIWYYDSSFHREILWKAAPVYVAPPVIPPVVPANINDGSLNQKNSWPYLLAQSTIIQDGSLPANQIKFQFENYSVGAYPATYVIAIGNGGDWAQISGPPGLKAQWQLMNAMFDASPGGFSIKQSDSSSGNSLGLYNWYNPAYPPTGGSAGVGNSFSDPSIFIEPEYFPPPPPPLPPIVNTTFSYVDVDVTYPLLEALADPGLPWDNGALVPGTTLQAMAWDIMTFIPVTCPTYDDPWVSNYFIDPTDDFVFNTAMFFSYNTELQESITTGSPEVARYEREAALNPSGAVIRASALKSGQWVGIHDFTDWYDSILFTTADGKESLYGVTTNQSGDPNNSGMVIANGSFKINGVTVSTNGSWTTVGNGGQGVNIPELCLGSLYTALLFLQGHSNLSFAALRNRWIGFNAPTPTIPSVYGKNNVTPYYRSGVDTYQSTNGSIHTQSYGPDDVLVSPATPPDTSPVITYNRKIILTPNTLVTRTFKFNATVDLSSFETTLRFNVLSHIAYVETSEVVNGQTQLTDTQVITVGKYPRSITLKSVTPVLDSNNLNAYNYVNLIEGANAVVFYVDVENNPTLWKSGLEVPLSGSFRDFYYPNSMLRFTFEDSAGIQFNYETDNPIIQVDTGAYAHSNMKLVCPSHEGVIACSGKVELAAFQNTTKAVCTSVLGFGGYDENDLESSSSELS